LRPRRKPGDPGPPGVGSRCTTYNFSWGHAQQPLPPRWTARATAGPASLFSRVWRGAAACYTQQEGARLPFLFFLVEGAYAAQQGRVCSYTPHPTGAAHPAVFFLLAPTNGRVSYSWHEERGATGRGHKRGGRGLVRGLGSFIAILRGPGDRLFSFLLWRGFIYSKAQENPPEHNPRGQGGGG
jgi:hypothetical protein